MPADDWPWSMDVNGQPQACEGAPVIPCQGPGTVEGIKANMESQQKAQSSQRM